LFSAQTGELPLLQYRSNFTCMAADNSPIARKKSLRRGSSKRPCGASCAVERAFFVAEKLRFDQAFGQRRDVAGDEWGAGARMML